eukprot:253219_1
MPINTPQKCRCRPLYACLIITFTMALSFLVCLQLYDGLSDHSALNRADFVAQCRVPDPIIPFRTRNELPTILEISGYKIGVEIGVQNGKYAKHVLSHWKHCEKYVLVDVWGPLQNYTDGSNVGQAAQDHTMRTAMQNTAQWKDKREVCRGLSTLCVKTYPDTYFDFIYVDARHDYKGVLVDLADWWPKLKYGGIMAGHDYLTMDDVVRGTGHDYDLNFDGTRDETGRITKGAVDDFFSMPEHRRQITVAYRESMWNTWAVRK